MASKAALASGSSCSELEAGNKSVDIWKTKDVKCEFFLEEGVIFHISLRRNIALHHGGFSRPQLTRFLIFSSPFHFFKCKLIISSYC